jgi:hypothetical protein
MLTLLSAAAIALATAAADPQAARGAPAPGPAATEQQLSVHKNGAGEPARPVGDAHAKTRRGARKAASRPSLRCYER